MMLVVGSYMEYQRAHRMGGPGAVSIGQRIAANRVAWWVRLG